MPRISAYHRPETLSEAMALLAEPGRAVVAGATTIVHDETGESLELVDVQALAIGAIESTDGGLSIGAAATLQQMVDCDDAPTLLRDTCRAEEPSTLRTLATIGGLIGSGAADSMVLAALLVFDGLVVFADGSKQALASVLGRGVDSSELIVAVEIEVGGATASARVARTPRDTPIVGGVGRTTDRGVVLALCGVAGTPVIVDPEQVSELRPNGDFRGSSEYRVELARVVLGRLVGELS